MTNVSEREPQTAIMSGLATKADRRRPRRLAQVSPKLIPLLRGQSVPALEPASGFGDPDHLGPVRGVFVSVGLSVPLWAVIGLAVRWIVNAL